MQFGKILAAAIVAAWAAGAQASVLVDQRFPNGSQQQSEAIVAALSGAGVDISDLVLLGRTEWSERDAAGAVEEDVGLALPLEIANPVTEDDRGKTELKSFDVTGTTLSDGGASYHLLAVYVKGGRSGNLYFDGHFTGLTAPGGKGVSHYTYVGRMAAVPVPAALPLFALALGGLGWAARRQRIARA